MSRIREPFFPSICRGCFYFPLASSDINECINEELVCDGDTGHCTDGSDEDPLVCAQWNCTAGYWKCQDGSMCIDETWVCEDFMDNSDEDQVLCAIHGTYLFVLKALGPVLSISSVWIWMIEVFVMEILLRRRRLLRWIRSVDQFSGTELLDTGNVRMGCDILINTVAKYVFSLILFNFHFQCYKYDKTNWENE